MRRRFRKTTLELGERMLHRMLEKDCQEVFRAKLRWEAVCSKKLLQFSLTALSLNAELEVIHWINFV